MHSKKDRVTLHEQWNGIPKGTLTLSLIFRTDTARVIDDYPFEIRPKSLIWRIGRIGSPRDGRFYLGLLPSALRARDFARVPIGFPADVIPRAPALGPSGA